jgi:Calx-beta domain
MSHFASAFKALVALMVLLLWLVPPTQAQTLSINDVSVTEGNSGTVAATFTVSLSAAAGAAGVTFDIATADGTALSGSDYVASNQVGQIIPAGNSTATFVVLVNGDTVFEGLQNYFVNVSNVIGATIADAQGIGVILNDEAVPDPSFTLASSSANEGATGVITPVNVAIQLPGPSEVELSFNFATADASAAAGSDYVSVSGILIFAPGETQKNLSVDLVGDNTIEGDETFSLDLLIPRGGNTHIITIVNDDAAGARPNAIPSLTDFGRAFLLLALALAGLVAITRPD